MSREDEDFSLSLSSSEYLTKGASQIQREKEGLKRNIEERQTKKGTEKDLKKLDTNVKATQLAKEITGGQKDDDKKRQEKIQKEEKKKEKGSKMGTKTIKQLEKAQIEGAGTKESADNIIRKEEQKKEEQSQADEEYQAQMG